MDVTIKPIHCDDEDFTLDVSKSGVTKSDLDAIGAALATAHSEMLALENGAIKNIDENRQVTHFTDRLHYRNSELFRNVSDFFNDIRDGSIAGSDGRNFESIIINGIGGSTLGPQLMHHALNGTYWNELPAEKRDGRLRIYFVDNTDSAGLDDILQVVELSTTLIVTISKSGSTRETKNNMTALEQVFRDHSLDFPRSAAAVTMPGSELDKHARSQGWLKIWPMAESIGGRTSVTAIVGHVPAAAVGINFADFLDGAVTMDQWTRNSETLSNPAYLLAAVWFMLGNGKGDKNMVILPYSDRLIYLSKYLQQLVMESLGKELDRDGKETLQGLTVFGNKGGSDAHAYVQQLNDGRNDFFITFIEILRDTRDIPLDRGLTIGDYLHNFMQGLVNALSRKNRSVVTITLNRLNARSLGMILALYERAVAYYAELININAFNQPGVQAYKLASGKIDELTIALQRFISDNQGFDGNALRIAAVLNQTDCVPEIEGILRKFAVNNRCFADVSVRCSFVNDEWTFKLETVRN